MKKILRHIVAHSPLVRSWTLSRLVLKWVMTIPSHHIRLFYLDLVHGGLGKGCTVCRYVEIRNPQNVFLGDHVVVNRYCILDGRGGRLVIGNNVDIALDSYIWTLQHDPDDDFHRTKGGDVNIGDYVWIASRANVLPGVNIGRGAVIAACSMVTKNVEENIIVGGIPAKKIGERHNQFKYTLHFRPLFE